MINNNPALIIRGTRITIAIKSANIATIPSINEANMKKRNRAPAIADPVRANL
jgi:hypothetical protein